MERVQKMADRNRTVNLWTARVIPVILAGVVGYATYVTIALLCVNYLLIKHDDRHAAIPILVIYFLLFIPMSIAFFRCVYMTIFDAPYIPLGPAAARDRGGRKDKTHSGDGTMAGEYKTGNPREDIDSPGLEQFYSKDVFVCEGDGKPIWCSHCANWKPDRTHHDSSSGRCIAKMDHFCPWVGGPVGENNFKFFIQFNFYTALYCLHLLIVMAIYVHKQLTTEGERLNHHFAAILGLAGFFCLFTSSMTGTSVQLVLLNLTQVERLGNKTKIITLCVKRPPIDELIRIDAHKAHNPTYRVITYPLQTSTIGKEQQQQGLPLANISVPSPVEDGQMSSGESWPEQAPGVSSIHPAVTAPPNAVAIQGRPNLSELPDDDLTLDPVTRASREKVSARDLQACKSFAILQMLAPGDNPWDLGSPLRNWQSVMGNNILDWFLPIRRSPCCNHEDAESHFALGPRVRALQAQHGFVSTTDLQRKTTGFLRRSRPRDWEKANEPRERANLEEIPRGDTRSLHITGDTSTSGSENSKMRTLNGHQQAPILN